MRLRHLGNTISLFLCGLLLVTSCVKKTSRGDMFEASFKLTSNSFMDGDEFGFIITANHSPVKVVDFKFPLKPDLVTVDEKYSFSDNTWKVTDEIQVNESQRGKLSITIEDVATGAQKSFEGIYTASKRSSVSMSIDNEVSSKTRFPNIVDGDDLSITLISNSNVLILTQYSCEFNDGTFSIGKEFGFRNGRCKVTIPHVTVTEDLLDTDNPGVISLTFFDPDNESTVTVSAQYTKMVAFTAEVSLSPAVITPDDQLTFTFRSNRKSITIKSVSGPSWLEYEFYGSTTLTTGPDGTATYIINEPNITSNSQGKLVFVLEDKDYTGRTVTAYVPYKAETIIHVSSLTVDEENVILDVNDDRPYPTSQTLTVTPDRGNYNNLYTVEILSGSSAIDVGEMSAADSQGRSSFTVTAVGEGPAVLKVFSQENPSANATVNIQARYRVALRINESAKYKKMGLCNAHGYTSSGQSIYTYLIGFPDLITAELVQWNGSADLSSIPIENASNITFSRLEQSVGQFSVQMKVETNKSVYYNKFYGQLAKDFPSIIGYNYVSNPFGNSKYNLHVSNCMSGTLGTWHTYLEENSMVHYIQEARSTGNYQVCEKSCSYLQEISGPAFEYIMTTKDNKAFYQYSYPQWDKISFTVNSIDYDKTKVDLQYVIYASKINASNVNRSANPFGTQPHYSANNLDAAHWNDYYPYVYPSSFVEMTWWNIPWWRNITLEKYLQDKGYTKEQYKKLYTLPFMEYDSSPVQWAVKYTM